MSEKPPTFLLLWFLFCASGAAALIYEVVWFQVLQLVIGSTGISLGLLLGTFMGGMFLGSLGVSPIVRTGWHPLRVYALLELGVGACGLAILFLLPYASRIYVYCGSGLVGLFARGLLSAILLLPPTILMGATLPTISRWLNRTPEGIASLGRLYAGNICGAVLGALVAGFYLLRIYDLALTTYVAVLVNVCVGLTTLYVSGTTPHSESMPDSEPSAAAATPKSIVYLVIGLSGFCAMSAEVVWTRLLSLMLGATVYTFSIILAVFLGGLALGSFSAASLARRTNRPDTALGICQLLLALTIAWAAFMLAVSVPYWPVNPSLSRNVWISFQLDLLRCAWSIFPAACLFGASFPLALAAASPTTPDQARLVGRLYAANTVGAVIGAVGASVVLLPGLGSRDLQRLLIGTSVVSGMLMFWARRSIAQKRPVGASKGGFQARRLIFALVSLVIAAVLIWTVPSLPWGLVAYGRYLPAKSELGKLLFVGEGMNASVAVTELSTGVRNFHVSGKVEASTDSQDMRLQRMLGHIPALLHRNPRSVLVVGCGAGVTAGSFVPYPTVEKILICEIEPVIPKVVGRFFGPENYDVLHDPRTRVVCDDARHFILLTKEKFDIITSDPIHPWVKGAATLYTKEYFELCKARLNPGGLVTQWVPLYESNMAVVRSELATFFEVFPNGTVWSNENDGEGYDVVLLGSADAECIDLQEVQGRLERQDYQPVLQSLREVGFRSTYSLFSTYAGRAADLKPWLVRAQINRDPNLRLQYLAGLGLNFNEQDLIYSNLLLYRTFPEELFVGSNVWKQALKSAIEKQRKK
ncbi:MAG TPA: fused MFS/spermidine synthase [Candidatus Limnocylindrales bacterium]|nr:fused MFS/spermidine synthase [Candidatus Limnocylindrales bacterium]